jgi:FkbM family methyltransferase
VKLFIENTVQATFGLLGLKVQRKDSPLRKLEGFCQHLKRQGFTPGTVIDVGVAYGTFPLYKTFPTSRHLLVEPLIEWEKTLQAISLEYRADYVIAAAASHDNGLTMNIQPDLLTSSSLEANEALEQSIARRVSTIRLDDYCRQHDYPGPYIIKVDVQGAELDVMEGCADILDDSQVVILETSLFQFYEGCPEFFDLISWMKSRNFVVYDICGAWNRPLDGALEQVDLVFVQEGGEFRTDHRACTPQQRAQRVKEYSRYKPIR